MKKIILLFSVVALMGCNWGDSKCSKCACDSGCCESGSCSVEGCDCSCSS